MSLKSLLQPLRSEDETQRSLDSGGRFTRGMLACRAGIALALDPYDTQQVFYLAQILDSDSFDRIAHDFGSTATGRELLREQPTIDSSHVDYSSLLHLPAHTLGGAYARALRDRGYSPDVFPRPGNLPGDVAYVVQRLRQTHDLWHVITGLDTDIAGEIALQAFTYAQLRQRFSRYIVIFGHLFFLARWPRIYPLCRRAYAIGCSAVPLLNVHWEAHWETPLTVLRSQLRLPQQPGRAWS